MHAHGPLAAACSTIPTGCMPRANLEAQGGWRVCVTRTKAACSSEAAPQASIMHPSHRRCKQNSERPHRGDCSVLNEWRHGTHAVLRQLSIATSSARKQPDAARPGGASLHHCMLCCSDSNPGSPDHVLLAYSKAQHSLRFSHESILFCVFSGRPRPPLQPRPAMLDRICSLLICCEEDPGRKPT